MRRKPYSVVLLDEIEKAHPDVFNILLQVLDEGHLTDNYGRVIDFKNTVVIMTSNVGARDITQGRSARASTARDAKTRFEKIAGDASRTRSSQGLQPRVPEPAGRRDRLPSARHASTSRRSSRSCCAKCSAASATRSGSHRPPLDFLVEKGYDESYGARPLKRAIQRYIEDPLSEKMLTGEFGRGDEIEVDVAPDGDKLTFRALTGSRT